MDTIHTATIETVTQRINNIRNALTRDGHSRNDIDRGMAFGIVQIFLDAGFSKEEAQQLVGDIYDAVGEEPNVEST